MSVTDRDISLSDGIADDLPRTLRRAREARERSQASMSPELEAGSSYLPQPLWSGQSDAAPPAVVTAIRMPFLQLVMFFFKAVFAALPAIALLGVIMWTVGHLMMIYYPWLVKVQILIRVPN
ncbi:MAG: hypothetical protein AB7G35_00805 [Hyphomicrobiaceae bacterium]